MTYFGAMSAFGLDAALRGSHGRFVAYALRTPAMKTKPFDAAEYLDSPEMIAAYLNEAFESEDGAATLIGMAPM